MTDRGKLVFGSAIGTPAFYLTLIICYRFFPRFPGMGPREIMNGDLWMAVGMALVVFVLGVLLSKLDPDLRTQTLLEPEPEEPAPRAPAESPTDKPAE